MGKGRKGAGAHALGRDPAAAREHVQRDALAEQDVPRLPAHRRDVPHGLERHALFQVPLHPAGANAIVSAHTSEMRIGAGEGRHSLASELREDLREEGRAGEDGGLLALPEEERLARLLADDVPAVVEGRGVFLQPGRHLRLPARR